MNFKDLKEKALQLKEKATEKILGLKNKSEEIATNATYKANELKEKAVDIKNTATEKVTETTQKANEIKDRVVSIKEETTGKANEIKDKVIQIKNEATEKTEKTKEYGKEKFYTFKINIGSKEELDFNIKKSATTSFINQETSEEKFFKHKSVIIFTKDWSDFLKKSYYIIPILNTKAFAQNIPVKFCKSEIEWINLADYWVDISNLPCLVVFEEEKVLKIIQWEEKILKLVKSFDLDINKLIEEA